MRTPVQPDRQEGRRARRRGARGAARTPGRTAARTSARARAAYLVVGTAVLAAGAPGLVGAVRGVRAADPERRAQAESALQLHGALLALCALLAVGVVVYAARGGRGGVGGAAAEGGGAGRTSAARAAGAELAAVRAELAAAKEHHVVERDSLLRERAALAERIGGLQASVQGTFVGLSRRTLGLVERQLSFIDELEAHEQEPGTLDTLFRLDHLAACMRRHSENQLVLAGADHRGARRAPVPLIDVLRAAVGEIESYRRVVLSPDAPQLYVTGFASADASHLLAELLENATSCSPPESDVLLTGRLLGTGDLLLVVRDEGIGISPPGRLDDLNARLADADPGPAPRESLGLGLYVVARLAARHGVGVELRQRERGLDAEVRLPARLLADPPGGGDGAVGGAVPRGGVRDGGEAAHGLVPPPGGGGEGRGAQDLAPVRDGGHERAHGAAWERDGGGPVRDGAPVRDDGAPVRDGAGPYGPGTGPVRLGEQRSVPTGDGGPAPARPATTPRTGGWVRAEAGMLPRREPGGTMSGAVATGGAAVRHTAAAGGGASYGDAAVGGAASGHGAPGDVVPARPATGHTPPGEAAPARPAPGPVATGRPAIGDRAAGDGAQDHPAPGRDAAGRPPAGLVGQRGAQSSGARPAAPMAAGPSGATPAAGVRTMTAVPPVAAVPTLPAQSSRQAVDAREVRRLLGGLQQGSRDGRRAAAAESASWEAKREATEQGAST